MYKYKFYRNLRNVADILNKIYTLIKLKQYCRCSEKCTICYFTKFNMSTNSLNNYL